MNPDLIALCERNTTLDNGYQYEFLRTDSEECREPRSMERVTFLTKDGQDVSSNNSSHIYPTAEQAHVWATLLPCGAGGEMCDHRHGGAHTSGACLGRLRTPVGMHLYTRVRVWTFGCYLTAPSSTEVSRVAVLETRAPMYEG
jgi:hypothetical protein